MCGFIAAMSLRFGDRPKSVRCRARHAASSRPGWFRLPLLFQRPRSAGTSPAFHHRSFRGRKPADAIRVAVGRVQWRNLQLSRAAARLGTAWLPIQEPLRHRSAASWVQNMGQRPVRTSGRHVCIRDLRRGDRPTLSGARPCRSEATALRRRRWLLHRRFGDQGDSLARRAPASDAPGVISRLSGLRLRARATYLVQRCPLHPARPLHGDTAIPAIESRSRKRGTGTTSHRWIRHDITKADALELIDEQIQRSVKSHLLSDVEVGALLSGGVDSGSIVATASRLTESPLRTFTIGFGSSDEDELPLARLVASRYKTRHHEEIVRESDFKSSVDGVLDIFDQPFADTSLVPTLAVSSVAAKSVKVVLTGDGGDEVFGGYDLGKYISPIRGPRPWQTMRLDGGSANELLKFFGDCLFYVCMPEARWNARNHYPRYVRSARRRLRLMPMELRRQLQRLRIPVDVPTAHGRRTGRISSGAMAPDKTHSAGPDACEDGSMLHAALHRGASAIPLPQTDRVDAQPADQHQEPPGQVVQRTAQGMGVRSAAICRF